MPLTIDDVVRLAADLPGVETGTSYGTPALRVGKKFMCRLREDDETLVLTPVEDIEQRFLMETQPEIFYKTSHYEGSPSILIHVSKVDEDQLKDLLEDCWRRLATKKLLAARTA
ncbi:MAG TPA: MmcQ/YjbR family DNA-binding protein [Dehalococcoidia bacterium]|jgi:hypothetical protein|nr:MmcQ/YjbR family DNA-binding protein [Dehalococcoidia bacterium]